MKESVIVYAKRTPIGKFMGGLSSIPAPRLTSTLLKDASESLKLSPDSVDELILGNVLTAGIGQAPARQAAIFAGLSQSVITTTIGKVCGSGLKSVMLADQSIRLGDARVVFAGGQENMSLAPHLLTNSRQGYRFGNAEIKDSMQFDGLWDPYSDMAMGNCGEICAKEYSFSRDAQDAFAKESYRRSRAAVESGHFANEIIPVEIKTRKETKLIEIDEEPFSVDLDKLAKLRPAFDKEGTITAGNASSINDGSALLMMTDSETAKKNGWDPLCKVIAQDSYAGEPKWFTTAPIHCIKKLLKKANLDVPDIDLWEINEAFAAVTMAAMHDLNLPEDKVNIHGGAVSLGHPIGCSGARILVTLIHALKAQNKKRGLAAICIGGGEASGVIVEIQ